MDWSFSSGTFWEVHTSAFPHDCVVVSWAIHLVTLGENPGQGWNCGRVLLSEVKLRFRRWDAFFHGCQQYGNSTIKFVLLYGVRITDLWIKHGQISVSVFISCSNDIKISSYSYSVQIQLQTITAYKHSDMNTFCFNNKFNIAFTRVNLYLFYKQSIYPSIKYNIYVLAW